MEHYANYKLDELQEFLKVWGPLYATQHKNEQDTKLRDIKEFAAKCCEVYENLIY